MNIDEAINEFKRLIEIMLRLRKNALGTELRLMRLYAQ